MHKVDSDSPLQLSPLICVKEKERKKKENLKGAFESFFSYQSSNQRREVRNE